MYRLHDRILSVPHDLWLGKGAGEAFPFFYVNGTLYAGAEIAVGVTWVFLKKGMVFKGENGTFQTEVDNAEIQFLRNGINMIGINSID